MNLYEHTIITRQDVSPSQLKQIIEKYSKIVEKLDGDIVKTENWGLLKLSYIISYYFFHYTIPLATCSSINISPVCLSNLLISSIRSRRTT